MTRPAQTRPETEREVENRGVGNRDIGRQAPYRRTRNWMLFLFILLGVGLLLGAFLWVGGATQAPPGETPAERREGQVEPEPAPN